MAINFKTGGQAPEKCPFRSCFHSPFGVYNCSKLLQARKAEGCGVMGSKDGTRWDDNHRSQEGKTWEDAWEQQFPGRKEGLSCTTSATI